ncbi:hypothetical protein ScPMuIL_018614 [Solemya velum]
MADDSIHQFDDVDSGKETGKKAEIYLEMRPDVNVKSKFQNGKLEVDATYQGRNYRYELTLPEGAQIDQPQTETKERDVTITVTITKRSKFNLKKHLHNPN